VSWGRPCGRGARNRPETTRAIPSKSYPVDCTSGTKGEGRGTPEGAHCAGQCRLLAGFPAKDPRHLLPVEPLPQQPAEKAPNGCRVGGEWRVSQPALECFLDHLHLVDVLERCRDRSSRRVAVDSHRLNLPKHSGPAVASDDEIVAGTRTRRASIVERAAGAKVGESLFDDAVGKSSAPEPVTQLDGGQLAATEEEQSNRTRRARCGIVDDLRFAPGHVAIVHRPPERKLGQACIVRGVIARTW